MNYILRRRRLGATSCREIAAQSTTGISVVRNDTPLPEEAQYVFHWGCTSTIPSGTVINRAAAIHAVADKKNFRLLLDEHELCPATWGDLETFRLQQESAANWPFVVRPAAHSQGQHVYLCNTMEEVESACSRFDNYYISEYIKKEAEYRVCVVQGRVAWVAQKTPANPEDVAWNVAKGGRFDNVRWGDWPLKVCRIAIEAFNLSGLDFGGVDIMVKEEDVYVLEINSAPSLTSPYRQACMAKCFDWIVQNGRGHIPLIEATGDWKKFAHPSLDERVLV